MSLLNLGLHSNAGYWGSFEEVEEVRSCAQFPEITPGRWFATPRGPLRNCPTARTGRGATGGPPGRLAFGSAYRGSPGV